MTIFQWLSNKMRESAVNKTAKLGGESSRKLKFQKIAWETVMII